MYFLLDAKCPLKFVAKCHWRASQTSFWRHLKGPMHLAYSHPLRLWMYVSFDWLWLTCQEGFLQTLVASCFCRIFAPHIICLFCQGIGWQLLCWFCAGGQSHGSKSGSRQSKPYESQETLKGQTCRIFSHFRRVHRAFCRGTLSHLEFILATNYCERPRYALTENLDWTNSCHLLGRIEPFRLSWWFLWKNAGEMDPTDTGCGCDAFRIRMRHGSRRERCILYLKRIGRYRFFLDGTLRGWLPLRALRC